MSVPSRRVESKKSRKPENMSMMSPPVWTMNTVIWSLSKKSLLRMKETRLEKFHQEQADKEPNLKGLNTQWWAKLVIE